MEMQQVRYFMAVAEVLNFTRAAEICNVSQPSLTRSIQMLESELGGPLFHRDRGNTHLTELGRIMEPYLGTVATQTDQARVAGDWAVALATGGKKPASTNFPSKVFEDSVTGKPNPVECKANLPGDIYLSAQLSAATQGKLVKK